MKVRDRNGQEGYRNMGKATGFLEYMRKTGPCRPPKERIGDFKEFHELLPLGEQKLQGARCMECGIPF